MKRHYTSYSWFTPINFFFFFFNNCLPNAPHFLYKRAFLSFALWTCLWFWCSLLVLDCNSLLFLNKPSFAGKITGSFILKVNRIYIPMSQSTQFTVFHYLIDNL